MTTKHPNNILTFVVGNLIHVKNTTGDEYDKTQIFRIDHLREEHGGSFHDGHTLTTIATITNIQTHETRKDVTLVYNNYMCRYCYVWAELVDAERLLG